MSATLKELDINGQKITTIYEKGTLPVVNFQLVFKNSGSINDKDLAGLANISASLLNEGTKKLGSSEFAELLESRAISIHTSSGFETFVIEISSLKSEVDFAFKYLQMLLLDPNLTKDTVTKLKNIMISSIKRKESDFDYVAKSELKQLIFKNTPLENQSLGTINSVSNIKLKDIQKFLNNSLTLSNLILVVGGDIEFDEFKQSITPILKNMSVGQQKEFKKNRSK